MNIEILAPVGNRESLIAAVSAGADAVYFGGQHFNARRNASNFDGDDLTEAIKYCRLNGVKSYLTLNILIKDSELEQAIALIKNAYTAGIDGVIIQDIGLAWILHSRLPELPLHASTQLSIHSAAALPLLKKLGFKRVVVAREMSENELIAFCKEAKLYGIEVEIFAHGALCMSVSGQCYFSAFLGGRSANRGLCAGTCRLPFSAKNGTGYDLSLKDLSLIDHIASLKKMGASSLKIEGRMKRPEYVAKTVSCIRKALQEGFVAQEDRQLLQNVFSRDGFTDGYFTGLQGKNMFGTRTEQDKQLSTEVLNSIHELYRRTPQKIPIDFNIEILSNKQSRLTARCEGHEVTVTGDTPEIAINRPLDHDRVRQSLSKLGGTPYFANEINCNIEAGLVLPISSINALRQKSVQEITTKRLKISRKADISYSTLKNNAKRELAGYFARFSSTQQYLYFKENNAAIVGCSLPAEIIVDTYNIDFKTDALAAELPRGAADDNKTAELLKALKSKGIKTVVCSNLAAVSLAKKQGFEIIGGFGLNIFNSYSVKTAKELNINNIVLSPELSFNELQGISADKNIKLFSMCYGRQPLMLTRNCPVKNGVGCKNKSDGCEIIDRLDEHFPVVCTNGFSEILNSKVTDISGLVQNVSADYLYLYFTTESPKEALEVFNRFLNHTKPQGQFTRGLFKNGVK